MIVSKSFGLLVSGVFWSLYQTRGDQDGKLKPKGDGGKGTGKKTSRQFTTNVATIYDLITKLARQADLTATTEQAMLIPDQIQPDGQPAPGSVRPIHGADVRILEPQGAELWLDVKIHTVAPDHSVAKELLREELAECRAYGQRDGFNLQALDRGMTPAVLEQYGRTAPGAQAIFNRIISHRLQILVRQGIPFLPRQKDRQLRAVGSNFMHAAPSSLAGSCRMCSPNRPGRLGRHTL